MLYKIIVDNKEKIVDAKRIKEIVKEAKENNYNIEVRKLDGTIVSLNKRQKQNLGYKTKTTIEECCSSFRKHVWYLLKQNKIEQSDYAKILNKAKEIQTDNLEEYKKELEELVK